MLSTAIVVFREMLEIAMILGVVLAATRGLPRRTAWVAGGMAVGLAGAGVVALFAGAISASLSGSGQEIFNAAILFAAALMIGCTVIWMRTHARDMANHLKHVGQDVRAGKLPLYSLSAIVALALLREGSEIVLFVYGMFFSGQSVASIAAGCALGVLLGCIAGVMLYYGLIRMSAKYVLQVTSWLLILLVAGLASQGASFLSAAGYFSPLSTPLWNTSWLLSEEGVTGKALHSLVGYSARPTAIQILFYLGTLSIVIAIIFLMEKKHAAAKALAAFCLCALITTAQPARALDEIYSPITEYKELSIEYGTSRSFDREADKDNLQEHELAIEYGLTPRLMLESSAGFTKNPDESLRLNSGEIEARYQFFEQGAYPVDAGLLAAYAFSAQGGAPDSLEMKLLLQNDLGKITNTANIGFEQDIGRYASGGPDAVFLWNTRYRHAPYFQPGIELQADLGQGTQLRHFSDQETYAGPAVWGKLFGRVKYQMAWLAGITNSASQSAARVLVEYEMHF